MTASAISILEVPPHAIYAPDLPRNVARCTCGWESTPSLFVAMVQTEADRHAHVVHGAQAPARRDTLAACWAEVHS